MSQSQTTIADMLKPAIPANPQKARNGLSRVWHAFGYSLASLRSNWYETAFRHEAIASVILLPAAFLLGRTWVEAMLLSLILFAGTWCMANYQRLTT